MQKFCHSCGKQLTVGAKFCTECGTNLSSLANIPTPAPPAAHAQTRQSQFVPFAVGTDNDDDDGDSYLDKLQSAPVRQNELHVEIVKDRPLGESVGALVSQAMQGGGAPISDPARPPQYTDGSQFLADFRKEAGTSREKK